MSRRKVYFDHKTGMISSPDPDAPSAPSPRDEGRAREEGLRQAIEGAADRIENVLGALAIPMPDRLQLKGIRETLPSIRDDLRAALSPSLGTEGR
jgi:hypothetical protein